MGVRAGRSLVAFVILVSLLVPAWPVMAAEPVETPEVQVIESTAGGVVLDVRIGGLDTIEVEVEGAVYRRLSLPYSGATTALGKPELPTFGRFLALPAGAEVEIEVVEATTETIPDVLIFPAQEPQLECATGSGEPTFAFDEAFYTQDTLFPGQVAMAEETRMLRGVPVSLVRFFPFQYNPGTRELTAYSHLRVRVRFDGAQGTFADERVRAGSFEPLYRRLLLNYEQLGAPGSVAAPQSPTGAEFLIITHPDFLAAANDLAAWRNAEGIDTEVRTTVDTGSTAGQIKAYIQNAYDTWTPAPEFVMLLGDHEYIPTNYVGDMGTDLYYFTVDGPDFYPDIHGGRVSVDTAAQAQVAIDDIIGYNEQPVTDEEFYNHTSHAAYFQDDEQNGYESRRFVRTSEEIRDYLLSAGYTAERIYYTHPYINPTHYNDGVYGNGEPLPADLLRPGFAWDGDAADITAAIQAGRFLVTHRDHGYAGGWGDPHYEVANVLALTNGDKLPVVFSMNCQSGMFDGATDPCFAEAWQRNPNGGAVGVIAATRNSYSGYNDFMTLGLVDAIWPELDPDLIPGYEEPEYRMGVVLNYGKLFMDATWGDPWGLQQTEYELFHYFGDPTMGIHTFPPFGDFWLGADPVKHRVCAPELVTSDIEVGQILDYTQDVTLAAMSVPAGVTAGFAPAVVTPPGQSTLSLDVSSGTADGAYTIVVSGTAEATNMHTVEIGLLVSSDLPGTASPVHPADGAVDVSLTPVFTWTPAARVLTHTLEVALDAGFNDVVYTAILTGSSHVPDIAFETGTVHYWRVLAENICGEGSYSETFSFRTAIIECQVYDSTDVPHRIPMGVGGSGTTTSTLDIASGGVILDVNVLNLAGTHTWMGDLDFYLDSPEGTRVHLMGQSCAYTDNFDLNLDDEAPPGQWPCPPIGGGTYQPTEPLSGFDGEDSTGTWSLLIVDSDDNDIGSLQAWSLEICNEVPYCIAPAIALYSDSPVELGHATHFTAELTAGTALESYEWSFGGPGQGAGLDTATPVFTYTVVGDYTATVTATNPCGSDFASVEASVSPVCTPVAGIELSLVSGGAVYLGAEVGFSADVAPDDAAKPYSYTVDFGDGTAPFTGTSSADPLLLSHTFASTGSHTVQISVWNCGMMAALDDSLGVDVEARPLYRVYLPIVVRGGD